METLPISMRESGAVVLKTKLYRDGQYLGSGIGARTLKQDSQDLNKMMKMARKSSVVDAVISTFGLSDLFTQDIEDMPQFNPSISPVLPKVKSVGDLEFTVLDITIKTSTNKRTYAELTIDTEEGEATALTSTELSDYLRTDGIHYWAEGKWGTRNGKRNFLITSTKDTIQRKHEDDSWQIGI